MGGLTPPLTTAATAQLEVLLTWLLKVLLARLNLPLALIGGGMHAGASAIGLGTGPIAVATHGGPGLITSQPGGALIVTNLMLDPSIAADQAVIAVAASVRQVWPVAVVAVVGFIGVVAVPVVEVPVAVVVVPVSIVVVVIAVPVDVVPGDVSVVVVVDGSPTASTTPVHSPCSEAPAPAEAAANEPAPTKGSPNRYPGAKGNAGCNGDRRCICRHHQGRAIYNCRVVLRNVNYVAAGGFNDDCLWALLNHLDLRRRL